MRSEFYWSFLGSLIIALSVTVYRYFQLEIPGEGESVFTFGLLPWLAIYFIVGVIMLFNKKSERFAKGLLLSTLILFSIIIFLWQGWIRF